MKAIYAPRPNGLRSVCTEELLMKLLEALPEYMDGTPFKDAWEVTWDGNEEEARFGMIKVGGTIYSLKSDVFDPEAMVNMRSDPRLIELFEKYANRGYEIADIPDDVKWDLWTWEYGEESIHEKHRSWT